MNDFRTSLTSRLLASLALLIAAWVLPAPAFAAHHPKSAAAAQAKSGKHQVRGHAAKAAKAGKAAKTEASESGKVCTQKGKGSHKRTVCHTVEKAKSVQSPEHAREAKSEKVCTRQGKGRHAKTVCKRVTNSESGESAKSERTRTERVCSTKGRGRHKTTVCKNVEKSVSPESAKSERSRTEKVCTSKGVGRHKKTVCKDVEKSSGPESAKSAQTQPEKVCTTKGRGRHKKTVCHAVEKEKVERADAVKSCSAVVIRHGRKLRVTRPCASSSNEPLLNNSPIKEGALDQGSRPVVPSAPVKARSAPVRAYAVDGGTFFHNGRKYRIEGLNPEAASGEHATQRLQQILDSGAVTVEPTSADENGAMRAVVRVGGRDVADLLKQKP